MTSNLKNIIKICNGIKVSINDIFVPPNDPVVPTNVIKKRKPKNTNPYLVSPTTSDSPTSSELAALFKKQRKKVVILHQDLHHQDLHHQDLNQTLKYH